MVHDTRSLEYRAPFGALFCGQMVRLRLWAPRQARVRLVTAEWQGAPSDTEMIWDGDGCYVARVYAPARPCVWGYCFAVHLGERVVYYGSQNADGRGGEGRESDVPCFFRVTVYSETFAPPRFLREGCMYQIFPDRFDREPDAVPRNACPAERRLHARWDELPLVDPDPRSGDNRALDFFGGNLRGIARRLPYLQELGVTVLYLNPIFMARTNHRYDTGDYTRVDPLLGTAEDFSTLCAEAKALGMRVLLDGVFSHTGADSVYFNRYGTYDALGAYQSAASPYADWFTFTRFPDEYRCWWGVPTLPEINKQCEGYCTFMFGERGVVRRWLAQGASGWRLDVADELPVAFLARLYGAAKAQDRDAAILCEVWEDASLKEAYGQTRCYCLGDTADSVMNYPLRESAMRFLTGQESAWALRETILHQMEMYPKPFFYSLMNLAGSHDRARALNLLAGEDFERVPWPERGACTLTGEQYALGAKRLLLLYRLLTALPGIPCVYYGDEAGMTGAADPFCRAPYPWGREDEALRDGVRALLRERHARPVLKTGDLQLMVADDDTLAVRRMTHAGRDAFGEPMRDDDVTVTICRR